jgi:hypothetical protein
MSNTDIEIVVEDPTAPEAEFACGDQRSRS